jgi:hypothetical protein
VRLKRGAFLIGLIALTFTVVAQTQLGGGAVIQGIVRFKRGPVPGAVVTAVNMASGKSMFYEVYDRAHPGDVDANNKTAARLLTNATFFRGNNKVYETPLLEVNQINTPDRKAATIELDVPLSELKAGFYTCQVNVIDEAAGEVAFPRLALLVR